MTADVVYVAGASGSLFAFNAQSGTLAGRAQAGGGLGGRLVRSDGLILATRLGMPGPHGTSLWTLVALRIP